MLVLLVAAAAPMVLADGNDTNSSIDDPDCVVDDDCEEGYNCIEGTCMDIYDEPECETDDDCEEGYFCDENKECEEIEEVECKTDEDCEEGYFCTEEFECEEIEVPECETDDDCAEGYFCNDDFECEKECDTLDCAEGFHCENNECVADDDSDLSDEDEDEIKDFHISEGAYVRMLQLEKALVRNIAAGEEVINGLGDDVSEEDINLLQSILDEMGGLLSEVRVLIDGGLEGDGKALASQFVEIKKEARSLSWEFRKKVHSIVSEEFIDELRNRIQERSERELGAYEDKIKEKRAEYNAKMAERYLGLVGEVDAETLERIESGEISVDEIQDMIKERYKDLAEQKKEEAKLRIQEAKAQHEIFMESAKADAEAKLQNRMQEWEQEREARAQAYQEKMNGLREKYGRNGGEE